MVTAKGDWKIDFEFDGRQICYAHPSEGHGPQEVKICVLDNWTDEHRTGKMTITDSENPQQPQVIQLGQKCNLDNGITRGEGGSFVTPNKGNRIYVVGYGYNMYKPLKEAVSMAPIVKVEALKDKGDFSKGKHGVLQGKPQEQPYRVVWPPLDAIVFTRNCRRSRLLIRKVRMFG